MMARKIITETVSMSRQTQTPGTALHAAAGRHPGTKEWPGARLWLYRLVRAASIRHDAVTG